VEKGEIKGIIPAIIPNELLHRIMIAETRTLPDGKGCGNCGICT
jgi:hypothetical protein